MIRIKGIKIYHPETKVGNEKYLKGKDERSRHFLEDVLGKKERYEIETETSLDTMKW